MNTLFNIEPEKYWQFPAKYTDIQKKTEIKNRIASNEYIGSEKIDGHYNKTVIDFDGFLRMESRTKSTVTGTYSDKQFHVPHIVPSLKKLPNGTILIGELYIPKATSQEVGKILGCKFEKAVARQEQDEANKLRYYIHDCWYFNNENLMDTPYKERIKVVKNIYDNYLKDNKYIDCAKWESTPDKITELMESVFAHDGEGIVLVRKNATVEPNKRTSWKTIKVKRELDHHIDCFFTGRAKKATRLYTGKEIDNWLFWEDMKADKLLPVGSWAEEYEKGMSIEPVTKGYYYGIPGSLEIGVMKDGEIYPIGYLSGLEDEVKANFEKYAMQPIEVTCMMFTSDGNLRHPKLVRMRDDIPVEDCTFEKYMSEQ